MQVLTCYLTIRQSLFKFLTQFINLKPFLKFDDKSLI